MFKQIDMYDGRYCIDENGTIINTITNKILSPYITNKGYYSIDLHCNGQSSKHLVHRLVASTFIPNPENLPIVMHLDNDRLNCNVSNLKWGTYSENNKQAVRDGNMIVPKPDNRKMYRIFNEDKEIICNGVKEIISVIGFGNDSMIRNYIFRKTPIPYGIYKGYYISKI